MTKKFYLWKKSQPLVKNLTKVPNNYQRLSYQVVKMNFQKGNETANVLVVTEEVEYRRKTTTGQHKPTQVVNFYEFNDSLTTKQIIFTVNTFA